MKVLTAKEVEEKYGLTEEDLDRMEADVMNGIFHGEPRGPVIMGRPLMFGEQMKQVGFKEPLRIVDAIDKRAAQLDMKRSDYLRSLVDADLASAGLV